MKQEWDKLPVTVETTSFRKTSEDFAFTIVTQRKYEDLARAFMGRISSMGVLFFVPCTSDQVDALLRDGDAPPAAIEAPAAEGQDKFFVPLDLMAQVLGVDPRTVQLDAEKGLLIRTGRGQYDTLASCATLRKALREAESGKNDLLIEERAKTIRFNREKKEADLHERLGRLVNYEEVQSEREKKNAVIRQKMLFLEKSLPPKLGGLSANEQEPVIRNEIRKLLTEFATLETPAGSAGESGQDIPAAAGPHREPVGGRKKKARRKNKR